MYLFLSLKWWQSFILWSVLCRFHSLYHCSHSLSLFAICRRSLPLIVTLCHLLYHSLSLVVIHCDLLSFVVTRYTNCSHSLYHSLPLVVIRCHSLSLDVPLVCLFINDLRNLLNWTFYVTWINLLLMKHKLVNFDWIVNNLIVCNLLIIYLN